MNPARSQSGADPARVALITGAAGVLGSVLVDAFVRDGYRVVAGWHAQPPRSLPEQVWDLPIDVTRPATFQPLLSRLEKELGRLDVVVHAAGQVRDRPLPRMSLEDWDTVVDVHLSGTMRLTRALMPWLLESDRAHILCIGSHGAREARAGQANYAAAKAGLVGWALSLARELGPHGIRVNVVVPGIFPSPMTRHLTFLQHEQFRQSHTLEEAPSLEELARCLLFLASTRGISGQVLHLDSRVPRWT
jgi:3-oxoacyl-[acyl-carrier protein] reductase